MQIRTDASQLWELIIIGRSSSGWLPFFRRQTAAHARYPKVVLIVTLGKCDTVSSSGSLFDTTINKAVLTRVESTKLHDELQLVRIGQEGAALLQNRTIVQKVCTKNGIKMLYYRTADSDDTLASPYRRV